MRDFAHFLAIDWSGARGERHKGIALALARAGGGPPELLRRDRPWSRHEVLALLRDELPPETLVGMDIGTALPYEDAGAYFPGWEASPGDAPSLWRLVDDLCDDDHLGCGGLLAHEQASRYFRHPGGVTGDRFHLAGAASREGRFRRAEHAQRAQGVRPVSNFNLVGAAQVGKATLTGMRLLHQLRGHLAIWPFDPLPESGSVLVEIYTSIAARLAGVTGNRTKLRSYEELDEALIALGSPPTGKAGALDDHSADALLAAAWLRQVARDPKYWNPPGLTPGIARTEGWTFGAV